MRERQPRVLWRGTDGSSVLASGDVASRYFTLRHPLQARRLLRRIQHRSVRLARLAIAVASERVHRESSVGGSGEPWWVNATEEATGIRVSDWLLFTGADADEKTIGFVFAGGSQSPVAVAKVARSVTAAARVTRGYQALEQLRHAGVTARGLAPEPLAFLRGVNGEIVSIESAIRGTWLDSVLRRNNEGQHVQRVTDWLVALGASTCRSGQEDVRPALVREVIDRFRENAAGLIDAGFLDDACSIAANIPRFSSVFEHHDCTPWNFYVTPESRLVAFDWDNAASNGVPAFDLVQAIGYLAFSIDGCLGTRRFAETFRRREHGALGDIRRECRTRYASTLGLADDAMRAVRVFAWMRLSNDEFERRHRARNPLYRPQIDRSMLGMWEAEARSAMDT